MAEMTVATHPATTAEPVATRRGAYALMVRWHLASIGATMLPVVVIVQAMLAVGIVVGFGFLVPSMDASTALFLSTGAPTVLLVMVGLVVVPQEVAAGRANGSFTYLRTLPIARWVLLASYLTVWTAVALPGLLAALLTAWLRYGVTFAIDLPLLLAVSILMVVMATAVGFAIAVSLPQLLAMVTTQVLVFFILLFSPITFPASQLPGWFQALHDVLPVQAAADAMRAALASDTFALDGGDLLVLGLWCLAGLAVSLRALAHRP